MMDSGGANSKDYYQADVKGWRTVVWIIGNVTAIIVLAVSVLIYTVGKYDLKADKLELQAVEQRSMIRDEQLKVELLRRADLNYAAIQDLSKNQLENNRLLGVVLGVHGVKPSGRLSE